MISSTDQLGNLVIVDKVPERIISLVPSQSELLWDLGLKSELKGITKFCIHPNELFNTIAKIGGTKNLNIEKIKSINPDIIIANKEENQKEQIEELQKLYPVWISDVNDLSDALKMIAELGNLLQRVRQAELLTNNILKKFKSVNKINKETRVIYLIWKDPLMAVSTSTFIDSMLNECGLTNVAVTKKSRYPQLTMDELIHLNPDYVFLSTEPYPFTEVHIAHFKKMLPNTEVLLVDGEYFSWYGSRLQHAPDYFNELLLKLK